MTDPVTVDALTTKELVTTVKLLSSVQYGGTEECGGNRANNLPTHTELASLATIPQIGSKVCAKGPPHKR